MTVTELALLRFLPGISLNTSLLEDLNVARSSMENFTGHKFYFFTQTEDPSLLYIIGEWNSTSQHMEQWIPSKENQRLLALLTDRLEVVSMYHLDVEPQLLPLEVPVISIARHFMCAGHKAPFQQAYGEGKAILESPTAPSTLGGGWRIEKEADDKEEWVSFSGWDSVEHQKDFHRVGGEAWYGQIQGILDGIEVRHLQKMEA